MQELGIALIQTNPTVGALRANVEQMARRALAAHERGARLIVFPELSVSGAPLEGLARRLDFLQACESALHSLARALPGDAIVLVGCPRPATNGETYNGAAVLNRGRVLAEAAQLDLSNSSIEWKKEDFTPGTNALVMHIGRHRIGILIGGDSTLSEPSAISLLKGVGLDALVNLSAFPYHRGYLAERFSLLRQMVCVLGVPLLNCNLVGGQDELVFDGASLVVGADGGLSTRGRQFEEDTLHVQIPVSPGGKPRLDNALIQLVKLDAPPTVAISPPRAIGSPPELTGSAEVYAALKLGLRDYADKNGFDKVVIALSGGLDSALVAVLAVDALGAGRVNAVTMPSAYSSPETRADALELARNLGIECLSLPIHNLYQSCLDALVPLWPGRAPDSTEENLQARIRGMLVMALSNKFGWLVLTTGNKSELATGYCTLYGDMAGGLAVLKDVPKTLVYELAAWRNATAPAPPIPTGTLERPPSAELRPNQKDTDTLPEYDVLDPILERFIDRGESAAAIAAAGYPPEAVKRVLRMVSRSEYKRRQAAPGILITPLAVGSTGRLPITSHFIESST